MPKHFIKKILTLFLFIVWMVNGIVCKVLNLVPRHEQIVAAILGIQHARTVTVIIGVGEILMAFWVLSRYKTTFNAIVQIALIVIMNVLEFLLVPHLLLWGRINALFALLLIFLIAINEFVLNKKRT